MFATKFIPPIGVRFNPTDEELIMCYLMKKVTGVPLPCDRIVERQVYGEKGTPWEIFPEGDESWNNSEGAEKNVVFVLISRTAGCGTWEGKSLTQDETNRIGTIIGQKRVFTFKPTKEFKSETKDKGRWIMHELSLPEEINKAVNSNHYVICRITRDHYT
ncbi:hypothetical protein ACJIZ3_005956 [Penstemon smallii]|uniref:NAC domain-containing protein n=1 Tax=Penstemon smallii TaxID=265156 RepID=A0ABD3S6H4_9LAMI